MSLQKTTDYARCILVGAGEEPTERIRVTEKDYLIAVDGGYDYCRKHQLTPDYILGDFDSLSEENREVVRKAADGNVKTLPVCKDDTDMLAAIRHGLELGYGRFEIYGGCGKRFDHTIANIQCLIFLKRQGVAASLYSNREKMYLISNEKVVLDAQENGFFSLFALQKVVSGVTIRGAKYEVSDAELTDDYPIGVSNEFVGCKVEICVKDGLLLLVHSLSSD